MRFQGDRPFSRGRPMRKRGAGAGGAPPGHWAQSSSMGGFQGSSTYRGSGGGGSSGGPGMRGSFRGSRGGFGGGGGRGGGGSFSEGGFYGGAPYRGGGFGSYGDGYGFSGGRGYPRGRSSYIEDRGPYRGSRGGFRGDRGGFRGMRGAFGDRGGFRGRISIRGDKMRGRGMFIHGRPLKRGLIRGRGKGATLGRSMKVNINDDGASLVADFQESFPCYLDALKHIVSESHGVSDISQLTIQCDSAESCNTTLEALRKLELDNNSHLTLKTVKPSRIDPLRKIAHLINPSVDLENLKTICEAESSEPMRRWDGGLVNNLYILKYDTEEAAETAQQKKFQYGEEEFVLRNYKKKLEGEELVEANKKANGAEEEQEERPNDQDVEMTAVEEEPQVIGEEEVVQTEDAQ